MNFNYFHVPTKIIQGYESSSQLNQMEEISRKRVILVTDTIFGNTGIAQNLRRSLENSSYGLIPFEINGKPSSDLLTEGGSLVKESRAQTVVGLGNPDILAFARGMVQVSSHREFKADYIEIPTISSIFPGVQSTYYIAENYDLIKRPYTDPLSRALWLILDSSYIDDARVSTILASAYQSLAYTIDALLSRKLNFLGESYALRAIELLVKAGGRLANEPTNTALKNELLTGSLLTSFALESSSLGLTAALSMGLEASSICNEAEASCAVFNDCLEYVLPQSGSQLEKLLPILGLENKKDIIENSFSVLEFMKALHLQMELKPLNSFVLKDFQLENAAKVASRYNFMSNIPRPAGYSELYTLLKKLEPIAKEKETSEKAVLSA